MYKHKFYVSVRCLSNPFSDNKKRCQTLPKYHKHVNKSPKQLQQFFSPSQLHLATKNDQKI